MKDNFISSRFFMGSVTNVSNRPWRRLVTEMGAHATISEMVIANYASKGGRQDRALMRRDEHENVFGVQIVGSRVDQLAKTAKMAEEMGADWIDYNCACPHQSVVSHKEGSFMLKHPQEMAKQLTALREAVSLPVTLKIRKGFDENDNVVQECVDVATDCGISAVFIHARTRFAQYRGPNDWELIENVAANAKIPIIGCGDLAHGSEVLERAKSTSCAGFALARGALMKPWIFKEIAEGKSLDPTSEERLEILKKLIDYTLDTFGHDAFGHEKARKFLHGQMTFLARYVPPGAYGRELPMQEREEAWEARDELEDLMRKQGKDAFNELLHLAGFDDNIEEKA